MAITTHNRWAVTFISAFAALLAVIAGGARQFLERIQTESRIPLLPDPLQTYSTLTMIGLTFLCCMAACAGLLMHPLERRRGALCLFAAVVCLLLLAYAGLAHGSTALRVLVGTNHTVGGSD